MQLQSYASDILEDAQVLSQQKAINSFSFRDHINTLTELWGYCYEAIARIDSGYYSRTVQLRTKLTTLPSFVKNAVRVYSAREQVGFARKMYQEAGMTEVRELHMVHGNIHLLSWCEVSRWG